MTNSPGSSSVGSQSPFDFVPYPTQDSDLLKQLEFIPGLKEILMLRQVHALEHATVWVLSESDPRNFTGGSTASARDNQGLGGMSTDQGFYLYGQVSDTTTGTSGQNCPDSSDERRMGFSGTSPLWHQFVCGNASDCGFCPGGSFAVASWPD